MDKYSLYARVYPVTILLLPIVIIGIAYSIDFKSYVQGLTSLGITASLVYLLSNLGRDKGKQLEASLWKSWGGAPSNHILSFNNEILALNTKIRFHKKLSILCPMPYTTSPDFENTNPNESKDIYRSWTDFVISKTRDIEKFPLLFQENISYAFRRNLLGLKPFAIALIVVILIGYFIWQAITMGFQQILDYPVAFFLSELSLVVLLLIWIFIVREDWVKIPAFAYAKRLFESLETIE